MYKPFKDARHLPLDLIAPAYQRGKYRMASVQASAVRGKDGTVHVAFANLRSQ